MKVLVLGGTGSIGGAVVQQLLMRGHTVVGLARSEKSAQALVKTGAEAVHGSIKQPDSWIEAVSYTHLTLPTILLV